MFLFGGLGSEDKAARLEDLRTRWQAHDVSEKLADQSDADLSRFLVARKYDVGKALEMLRQNAHWRAETFPMHRSPAVQAALARQQLGQVVAWSSEDIPIVLFDCCWGKLLEGLDEETALAAYLCFVEDLLEQMAARGASQFSVLSIGGPPPMGFSQRMTKVCEANYPERLHMVVIAPVPRAAKRFVEAMLWFLPERTKSKFGIASSTQDVCEALKVEVAQLPPFLQDLEAYEAERMKLGIVVRTQLENGDEQFVRTVEVPAGEQLTVELPVEAGVEGLELLVAVESRSKLSSMLVGTQGAKIGVAFQAGEGPADKVVPVGTLVNENAALELSWSNKGRGPGALAFEVDNRHSSRLGKGVLLQVTTHTRPV